MATMYERGRHHEYRVINRMKKEKCWNILQRTAGSHSPFDVIAINLEDKIIKLIQVKPANMTESKKQAILEVNRGFTGLFHCEFLIS